MIHNAKDLSPGQKSALESLLGRAVAESDAISIRVAPPAPPWLQQSWATARQHGLDRMTPEEIDAEIDAARRARGTSRSQTRQ
jgi:hypothetical protein